MKKWLSILVMTMLLSAFTVSAHAETYEGVAFGRNGEVKVEVSVDAEGTITSVEIGENSETPVISAYAFDRIPNMIVEHQTINIDSVSGATMSSNAIKNAVKDALKQAGLDPDNYQDSITYSTEDRTLETEIVIVGAGGSGLSAAVEGANAGKKVLVIESNVYAGGSTLYCGGMVMYAATPEEVEEYGSLDAEMLYEGIKAYASEAFNDELTKDFLNHTQENLTWLKSLYSGNDLVDSHDPGWVPLPSENGTPAHTLTITIHPKEGDALVNTWVADSLLNAAQKAGAEFLYETTADELLTDDDGNICGIHATDVYGNTYTISAKKVILACGGFGGNYDMLLEHTDIERPFYLGPTSNKGWGIIAGQSVGAKLEYANLPDLEGYDSMVYGTVGGLIVNEKAEVLDESDSVIPNLYAAGELTCVQVLDTVHFSAGENNAWNVYSGRIAGEEAAKAIS